MQTFEQQNANKMHFSIIPYGITMSKIFRCLFSVPHLHYLFALIPVGRNFILYYYSISIHFRDHLASILNVTVGFLSLFYLFLFGLSLCLFLCFPKIAG